ncbi:MAG: hypothetical protein KAJ79_05595, partial [Candidatus Omnitrophica bacterium]|nr:hypothetical protein [Candidatus Omnitrophota bacterium]
MVKQIAPSTTGSYAAGYAYQIMHPTEDSYMKYVPGPCRTVMAFPFQVISTTEGFASFPSHVASSAPYYSRKGFNEGSTVFGLINRDSVRGKTTGLMKGFGQGGIAIPAWGMFSFMTTLAESGVNTLGEVGSVVGLTDGEIVENSFISTYIANGAESLGLKGFKNFVSPEDTIVSMTTFNNRENDYLGSDYFLANIWLMGGIGQAIGIRNPKREAQQVAKKQSSFSQRSGIIGSARRIEGFSLNSYRKLTGAVMAPMHFATGGIGGFKNWAYNKGRNSFTGEKRATDFIKEVVSNPAHQVKEGLLGPIFIPLDIKMVREKFLPGAQSNLLVNRFVLPDQYASKEGLENYRKLGGLSPTLFGPKDKKLSLGFRLKIAFAGLRGLKEIGESNKWDAEGRNQKTLISDLINYKIITNPRDSSLTKDFLRDLMKIKTGAGLGFADSGKLTAVESDGKNAYTTINKEMVKTSFAALRRSGLSDIMMGKRINNQQYTRDILNYKKERLEVDRDNVLTERNSYIKDRNFLAARKFKTGDLHIRIAEKDSQIAKLDSQIGKLNANIGKVNDAQNLYLNDALNRDRGNFKLKPVEVKDITSGKEFDLFIPFGEGIKISSTNTFSRELALQHIYGNVNAPTFNDLITNLDHLEGREGPLVDNIRSLNIKGLRSMVGGAHGEYKYKTLDYLKRNSKNFDSATFLTSLYVANLISLQGLKELRGNNIVIGNNKFLSDLSGGLRTGKNKELLDLVKYAEIHENENG